jgi:GNAT superfamily N-acetyltransferase
LHLSFEPLDRGHARKAFSCGQPDLDDWFHRRAGQDQRRNVSRVFVATDKSLGIVGFYSLSALHIDIGELPDWIAKRLPRYDAVPAALIGRLARDVRVRGQGVGDLLLADAIRRLIRSSDEIAIFAVIADAKDKNAEAFYRTHGFASFPSRPMRLYLPIATASEALSRI